MELFGEHLQQLAFVQDSELEQDLSEQLPGCRLLRQCVAEDIHADGALANEQLAEQGTVVAVGKWFLDDRLSRRDRIGGGWLAPTSLVPLSKAHHGNVDRVVGSMLCREGQRPASLADGAPMAGELPTGAATERALCAVFSNLTKPLLAGTEPGAGFAWLPTRRSDHFIRVDQGLPCTPLRASRPKATECDWT